MIGRKCYRALVLSFLAATSAHALDVGGHIQTTTWTAADSPVRVVDTVYVDVGATLTIGPGVDVLFDADVPFCVAGALVAEGTATDSIRFLPGSAESWSAIHFGLESTGDLAFVRVSGAHAPYPMDLGEPYGSSAGGGMSCYGATLSLSHCAISGNESEGIAGGLAFRSCAVEMELCVVVGNRSDEMGGGVYASAGSLNMTGCVVADNTPYGVYSFDSNELTMTGCTVSGNAFDPDDPAEGGGLGVCYASATLSECLLEGNVGPWSGGGVWVEGGEAVLSGCKLIGNASPQGSALSVWRSSADVLNCTVAGGVAPEPIAGSSSTTPSAIAVTEGAVLVANSVVWGNHGRAILICPGALTDSTQTRAEYSDLQGDVAWPGPGNICADPLFTDPGHGDYGLQAGSPCIDSGSPYYIDADGSPADMGAGGGSRLASDVPWIDVSQSGDCSRILAGTIDIRNRGGGELTVSSIDFPSDFVTGTVFPLVVQPGCTEVVHVVYTHATDDTVADATIHSDDPARGAVDVSLRGTYGTAVSAYQFGRWTLAGSPYRVMASVVVPVDKELIIDAGVRVLFERAGAMENPDDDGCIHAVGRLVVDGTETDSVTFRLGRPDARGGVATYRIPGHRISYALFDGLTSPLTSGSGSAEYAHCVIRNMAGFASDNDGGLVLSHCTISHCGPALSLNSVGSAEFSDCEITDNRSAQPIYVAYGSLDLHHCLIAYNVAAHSNPALAGDVMALRMGARVSLSQCTVTANASPNGPVISVSDAVLRVLGSVLSGNASIEIGLAPSPTAEACSLDIQYSNVHVVREHVPGASEPIYYRYGYPGPGNIGGHAQFVDEVNRDYHLVPGSACVDAGHPYYRDADGSPADMGVFGGTGARSGLPEIRVVDDVEVSHATGGSVDVRNIGGGPLVVDSVSFTVGFSTGMTFPQTVPAGDTLAVPVLFNPDPLTDASGSMTVYHSDTCSAPVAIDLQGRVGGRVISGSITGVLTAADAPYRVTADLLVPEGETLEIEAGVTLMFDSASRVLVLGRIRAHGTEEDSVVFCTGLAPHWLGIALRGPDSSSFSYTRISGAPSECLGIANGHRVGLHNSAFVGGAVAAGLCSTVTVTGCSFRSPETGCSIGGTRRVEIEDCSFVGVPCGCQLTDCANALVEGCSFRGCDQGYVMRFLCVDIRGTGSSASHVRVSGCRMENNSLPYVLLASGDAPVIIEGDTLLSVELDGCTIAGNDLGTRSNTGSGVLVRGITTDSGTSGPTVLLSNCAIIGNHAHRPCAVVANAGCTTIEGCTIAGNRHDTDAADPLLAQSPGLLYPVTATGGAITIHNSIVWGELASSSVRLGPQIVATYSALVGGHDGTGNTSANPLFADAVRGDYSLATGSPCINTGDPDSPLDQDGTRCDMGAHANISVALGVEQAPAQLELSLGSPFPNPFNPTVSIPYTVPEAGHVGLTVYNVQGQVVRRLVDGTREAGTQTAVWDGRDAVGRPAASGVYLCRLTTTAGARVRRMLLVR